MGELTLILPEPTDLASFTVATMIFFVIPFCCCVKKLCCVSKKRKKSIPSKLRKRVWEKYFKNNDFGNCYACGRTIYSDCWHCSHVIAEQSGGKCTLENLRPCCPYCNLSMRTQNLYDYIKNRNLSGLGRRKIRK